MRLEEMIGCCTARVLFDLGGSSAAMYRGSVVSKEDLDKEWDNLLEEYHLFTPEKDCNADCEDEDEWEYEEEGNAVVIATTTTEQEVANEFLKSKGFLCVGPYKKPKHPETGLCLWWLPIYGVFGKEG